MTLDNMVMFGSYLGIGNIWVITIIISVTDKVVFALRYKILTGEIIRADTQPVLLAMH